jgi:hypothetical protein
MEAEVSFETSVQHQTAWYHIQKAMRNSALTFDLLKPAGYWIDQQG